MKSNTEETTNNLTISDEDLQSIKDRVAGPIFKKNIRGRDYIFRMLTRGDRNYLQDWSSQNPNAKFSEYDDIVVERVLLWPNLNSIEKNTLPAGINDVLSNVIQQKAFMIPGEDTLECEQVSSVFVEQKPSDEEIEDAKSKTSNPVFKVGIAGIYFLVRPLLRLEYKTMAGNEGIDYQVETCKRCTLWPKEYKWNDCPAGIPEVVAGQILKSSGFQDEGSCEEV
jgi:hypothetical protein